jgi:ribA/ribD-fused uncharacterized protein
MPDSRSTDACHLDALRARHHHGDRLKFLYFWGHQRPMKGFSASSFSQWNGSAFDGQRYPTAEHYMMAEKARLFGDEATRSQVLIAPNPGAAKALGRQVRGFDDDVWTERRFEIVVRANLAKFGQNAEIGDFLTQTGGRVLVEASPVDRIWGIGMAADDHGVDNPDLWRGLNLLGFALMRVRDRLAGAPET